jgi:hypothetical protein
MYHAGDTGNVIPDSRHGMSQGSDLDDRACERLRCFLREVVAYSLDDVMHPLSAKICSRRRSVRRGDLPKMHALNFVIENALGGGVTISLAMDAHGKTLSYIMQDIELPD